MGDNHLKARALLIFIPLFVLFSAQSYEIPIRDIHYEIFKDNDFDRIRLTGAISLSTPGSPELPAIVYNYLLPQQQQLEQVEIVTAVWTDIPGEFHIYPKQHDLPISENTGFTQPEPEIYDSDSAFPEGIIINAKSGNLRGYAIAQVVVSPFRYMPKTCRLSILKKLIVKIDTKSGAEGISPKRQTSLAANSFNRFISHLVANNYALHDPYAQPLFFIEENPEDLAPAELPSLLGPPVDLVVITTESQMLAYEKYARLKKLQGFNTTARTLTWIRQNYAGIDDAERIRNFIKDAVVFWGVGFVLLGGDVPEIPTRTIWHAPLQGMGPWPVCIATDLYFSDLDKNWNADADEFFGEVEDSVDMYPDVYVGRLPADSDIEIDGYLNKVWTYSFPPSHDSRPPSQIKALFVSSNFDVANDAYVMAQNLSTHLPSHFSKLFLNERPIGDFKDSLCAQFNLVTVLGHGDVNIIRIQSSPRQHATNYFYDSLANTVYPLMVVITCYTNPFQVDCLGKHWVVNPSGGGIGYIGPTMSSIASTHELYTDYLFDYLSSDSIYSKCLAVALAQSKIPLIASSQDYGWTRTYQFSLCLLGDPTLCFWDSIPRRLNSVVTSPETLCVGIDTINLSINPTMDFSVVLYKENEVFVKDSGFSGNLELPIKTESQGYLKYTILIHNFIPCIDSILVKPTSPFLVCNGFRCVDSLNNSNGAVNPGEHIFWYVKLKNNGSSMANSVNAQISCADSFITMITDTASYANINPGESKENQTPFYFKTSNAMPDEQSLNFSMLVDYSGVTVTDTFQIIASAPRLYLYTQYYTSILDTLKILPFIENRGHALADSVYAQISAYSDTILVIDSVVEFPGIAAGGIVSSKPDSFTVYLNHLGSLLYDFRAYYLGNEIIDKGITLNIPARTDSIWALGTKISIILEWTPVSGAIGYRIYRSTNPDGPYHFLKNQLSPDAYFEDFNIPTNNVYYYYLFAVDSSMNEGISSDTIYAQRNPLLCTGWPQPVYGYIFSSPGFGDIDPGYPGLEIVVGGCDGAIYAWHYDGTPVGNDSRLFQIDNQIWSSPAVGDVNQDGQFEIVFGARSWFTNNLYVINNEGVILPGWPKSLIGEVLTSPALEDIDENGDLEIFVCSDSTTDGDSMGFLYAFHHDGNGVFTQSGLLKRFKGGTKGSPALGDVNHDSHIEIVICGGRDSLFVWNHLGNYQIPFPVPVISKMIYSPVLGDVMGDERLEICFYTDFSNCVHLFDAEGNQVWMRYLYWLGDVEASPIIADITGDGRPEIICGNNTGSITVFDSLGNMLSGFPPTYDHNSKLPIAVDAGSDSSVDVVYGSSDWFLYAHDNHGGTVSGFPIIQGVHIDASPAAYDIDYDGNLELMVGSNSYSFNVYKLNTKKWEWPKFRYDQYNTGTYKSGFLLSTKVFANLLLPVVDFQLCISPNPFRTRIDIRYAIQDAKSENYSLKIFNAAGCLVRDLTQLLNYRLGNNQIRWSGDDNLGRKMPAGVYFVRLESSNHTLVKKAILLR